MDRYGHVRPRLPRPPRRSSTRSGSGSYRNEKIHLSNPRFAWIDTLFALPEACLFAGIIELLEASAASAVDYAKLLRRHPRVRSTRSTATTRSRR